MIRSIGVALAIVGSTVLTIPRGTDIPVTLDEDVPIAQDRVGDTFEAHVTRDVKVKGEVVIPAGSPAEVKLVKSPEKADAATLRLTGINVDGEMRSVNTDVAKADSDGDNLTDAVEQEIGTDPFNADSDGDGLSDFVEVGFDDESATGTNPALWDSDGDGVSDAVEVANGTNPNDPGS